MVMCPPSCTLLTNITLSPILQSCAICTYAIIKQFCPIFVVPEYFVPLLIVTHSRIIQLSPISARLSSPPNFKSCGIADITAPGNILQFLPILAPSIIVTLDPIQQPSPISTFFWMVTKESILTFFAIFA